MRIRTGSKARRRKGGKTVSKAMKQRAEEVLAELTNYSNGMFGLVKISKIKVKNLSKMNEKNDRKLCFSDGKRAMSDYVEKNMNEEKIGIIMWQEMQ